MARIENNSCVRLIRNLSVGQGLPAELGRRHKTIRGLSLAIVFVAAALTACESKEAPEKNEPAAEGEAEGEAQASEEGETGGEAAPTDEGTENAEPAAEPGDETDGEPTTDGAAAGEAAGEAIAEGAGATGAGTASADPADAAGETLAVGILDGKVTRISDTGAVLETLEVPGLGNGFGTYDRARRSVVVFTEAAEVWEVTLEPKLDARNVGTVTLPDAQTKCLEDFVYDGLGGMLQSHRDLTTTLGPPAEACLVLMDRNENMMSVEVTVALPLQGGPPESAITQFYGEVDGCVAAEGLPPCTRDEMPEAPPAKAVAKQADVWESRNCSIVATDGRELDLRTVIELPQEVDEDCEIDGVGVESESLSGRWVTVGYGHDGGDYIHREVAVLDMGPDADTAPKVLADLGFSAVGETRVAWSETAEAAIFEDRLVIFGDAVPVVVAIGGAGVLVR